MNRFQTEKQAVKTPFGTLYLHLLHDSKSRLTGMNISIPGSMHGKELGDVLEAIVVEINKELE